MKLALLIALSADKRQGTPLGDAMPYDQALNEFKRATTLGFAPAPDRPVLELWAGNSPAKSHRFKAPAPKAKPAKKAPDAVAADAALLS